MDKVDEPGKKCPHCGKIAKGLCMCRLMTSIHKIRADMKEQGIPLPKSDPGLDLEKEFPAMFGLAQGKKGPKPK